MKNSFRVYDKTNNMYYYPEECELNAEFITFHDKYSGKFIKLMSNDFIIQKKSSSFDMSDKSIYEGDCVEVTIGEKDGSSFIHMIDVESADEFDKDFGNYNSYNMRIISNKKNST